MLQGAALAALSISGCSGEVESPTATRGGGEPSSPEPQSLQPYSSDALACYGKDYGDDNFGYHGQCCTRADCYTPDDGVCAPAESAATALGIFFGSGRCSCTGDSGRSDVEGPFAPNPTDTPSRTGSCCYLVTSISCDGRPLLVDGVALVSALVARIDWLASDLRAVLLA